MWNVLKKKNVALAVIPSVLTGIAVVVIPRVGVPVIIPDEFGYWAQAAAMSGLDWTEVAGQFSWYSFGYSLLMLPFLQLIRDPVLLYRCMVGVNFLLLGISFVLLYLLMRDLLPDMDRGLTALLSGIGVLYASCVTYAQTTMTETLLTFLYLLLAYCLHRCWRKPGLLWSVLAALTAGYMYMVHMRTVGILLATAVCVLTGSLKGRKRQSEETPMRWVRVIASLFLLAALFVAAEQTKALLVENMHSETYRSLAEINHYSSQWGKFRSLFSLNGFYQFLVSFGGKLFYTGCATFGLYYWGMGFLIRKAWETFCLIRKREEIPWERWVYLWLLLSGLSALLIASVAAMGSDRLDGALYGRYHENTVPVFIALGAAQLLLNPMFKKRCCWLFGVLGSGFFLVFSALLDGRISKTTDLFTTGIYCVQLLAGRYGIRTLTYAYVFGTACSLGIMAAIEWGKSERAVLLTVLLLYAPTIFFAGRDTSILEFANREGDVETLRQVERLLEVQEIETVFYLTDDVSKRSCLAQFMLPDYSLHVVNRKKMSSLFAEIEETVLVIADNIPLMEENWEQGRVPLWETYRFRIYLCAPEM